MLIFNLYQIICYSDTTNTPPSHTSRKPQESSPDDGHTSRPWESDISDCKSCYHHPSRACTTNIQWCYLLTAHASTWPLLLITWCPFWKLWYILVTSRHSDGRPQDVLCSRHFNHPKQIPPQAVDAAESSDLWHRSIWRHNETMGHTSLLYFACGRLTQSVQHVVVDSVIHKAPDGLLVSTALMQQLELGLNN